MNDSHTLSNDLLAAMQRSAAHSQPVRFAFTGVAYLRRLAGLRRRASAGLPLFADGLPSSQLPEDRVRQGPKKRYDRLTLPNKRKYETLLTVGCANCGLPLLAETEEPTRALATRRKMLCVRRMPPPVGMRAGGRPYCEECVDLPVRRVGA